MGIIGLGLWPGWGVGQGNTREALLGRHAAQGNLCHHRPAHARAVLRRLGLRRPTKSTVAALPAVGYTKGVPMGGDLRAAPTGKAPTFMVRGARDLDGANLDRIQIIKGWLDAKGKMQEQMYDVAVSDGRKIDADGRCRRRWATRWTCPTPPGPTPSAPA